jgi:hypothetical protein
MISIKQSASLDHFCYEPVEYLLGSNLVNQDTLLNVNNATLYSNGDKVFISNNGVYEILKVLSSTQLILNLNPDTLINPVRISKIIQYQVSPDPTTKNGYFNYQRVLKDYVQSHFSASNEPYETSLTSQTYALMYGEAYEYSSSFTDNLFVSGNVGFINPSITSTASVPWQIGDQVVIQQQLTTWSFDDNHFWSGSLAFTGSTNHFYRTGSQVFITGQTVPSYNGYANVIAGTSGKLLVVDKTFTTNTPTDNGVAYGTIAWEYNDTVTITSMSIHPSNGLTIVTDLSWSVDTPPVAGTIKYADGRLYKSYDNTLYYHRASIGKHDYVDTFNSSSFKYYYQVGTYTPVPNTFLISTILSDKPAYNHKVTHDTKSWLLIKNGIDIGGNGYGDGLSANFLFYDATDTLLAHAEFGIASMVSDQNDWYFPIGLNQLIDSQTLINGGTIPSALPNIAYYTLDIVYPDGTSNMLRFNVDTCTKGYDEYHLIFEDSLGSFMSYPFYYKSFNNIEVDTNTYTKRTGVIGQNKIERFTYDRGKQNLYKRYTDKLVLNTGFINEDETFIIKDLLTSPNVYIQLPDSTIVACQVLNNEVELVKQQNGNLANYSIQVAYSLEEVRY